MKSLHTLLITNKAGERLAINLDSDAAKFKAIAALEAQGIDYVDDSPWGSTLTGSTNKQQAAMLETVKHWLR